MFFLLFGLRTRDEIVDTTVATCEVCGWTAPQQRLARTTRFTLFFVPLFPVRPKRHLLRCGHCMALRAAHPQAAYAY
ncbi:zinc-ribbon domain-containing protein [Actinoplanes siamensis]|nr:zinc-ribbon domain-containing protein [Actinoplanes siamensis]